MLLMPSEFLRTAVHTEHLMVVATDLYYVPDAVRPIYFLSDHEDSQA